MKASFKIFEVLLFLFRHEKEQLNVFFKHIFLYFYVMHFKYINIHNTLIFCKYMDGVWDDVVASTVVSDVVYYQNPPTIHSV